MSRYTIAGRAPGRSVALGWDPPLRTFFAQVHDADLPEDENPVAWFGAEERIPEIEDLRRALSPMRICRR